MIYLDNAATTKPSLDALKFAEKFNNDFYYNPSALYNAGLGVAKEIKSARESLLKNIGATNYDIIFSSCGSESNNTAIFCSVKRGVFVTDKGEHSAVYKCFLELKNRGQQVEFVSLLSDGRVDTENLFEIVKKCNADFVSIMHVNNETGGINDVNYIGKKLKEINNKIVFHVDGVQAYGKIPYRISKDVDLYSISAHKINALKGTGALIKKKGLNLSPLIFGGGQEGTLRSGTENVFGIKVFEYSASEKYRNLKSNFDKVLLFKNKIIENINKDIFTIISSENSSPYILTVSAVGVRGEVLMHALETQGVIVGNGSACSSKNRFSRVIEACGYKNDVLDGIIRISFSTENTLEEIEKAIDIINQTANNLKRKLK